jgi:hypothetical protein
MWIPDGDLALEISRRVSRHAWFEAARSGK